MPDLGAQARFGVVDFGARVGADRGLARDYTQALVVHRQDGDADLDYRIEFACVTHPHNDHYGGLARFMAVFANRIEQFWDCGFRTNSTEYNGILVDDVLANPGVTFVRLGSGSEFEYGPTGPLRITVLAKSVDMRNRFDTYGVGKNDASIVLRVNLIYKYDGNWSPRAVTRVAERADGAGFQAALVAAWNG